VALGDRKDPYLAFDFLVEIEGLVVGGFTDVTGLQREVEVQDYREGGVNEYVHKLWGPTRYPSNPSSSAVSRTSPPGRGTKPLRAGSYSASMARSSCAMAPAKSAGAGPSRVRTRSAGSDRSSGPERLRLRWKPWNSYTAA